MFVVVAYDIVEDRRRDRLARMLHDYGRRVQKSVFECVVDEKRFLDLRLKVEKEIDMTVDSVRYYFLCQRCVAAIQVSGLGTVTDDDSDSVIIV